MVIICGMKRVRRWKALGKNPEESVGKSFRRQKTCKKAAMMLEHDCGMKDRFRGMKSRSEKPVKWAAPSSEKVYKGASTSGFFLSKKESCDIVCAEIHWF